MGGGGFLLTDVADWVPGRHEVASRLALLGTLGLEDEGAPRVEVHVRDSDRIAIARRLREAWSEAGRLAPRRALPISVDIPGNRTEPTPALAGHSRQNAKVAGQGARTGLPGSAIAEREGRDETPSASVAVIRPGPFHPVPRDSVTPLPVPQGEDADDLLAGVFENHEPLLAVHVGAGTSAKRWPIEHWNTLLQRFLDDGWRVVVLGGSEDEELVQRLQPHPGLFVWTGLLSIAESAALLERADLFLGADSGPAHLAASSGVTSVILFSGTNQRRQWRPFSRRSLVLRHRVACQPCHRKVCPLSDHPCMTGLTPDRVYRAARRWWARLHRQESPHAPL